MKDELAKRLVQGLKDAGINFVTYLPETRLSQIVPLIRDDPDMELIAVANESEAITIAAGATLGGKQAAVYMENTGIYTSCYPLVTVGKQLGVPPAVGHRLPGRCAGLAQQFSLRDHRQAFDSRARRIGYRPYIDSRTAKSSRSKSKTRCARPILCAVPTRCFSPGSFPNDSLRMFAAVGQ